MPTPARCYALGQAIGRAIESYPADIGVVVIATGGLSHQLDGERAGFINKAVPKRRAERSGQSSLAMIRRPLRLNARGIPRR